MISDIKNPMLPGGFEAKLLASYDYFPFGMEMPGFGNVEEEYRYGFNGMEKGKEMKGNSYFRFSHYSKIAFQSNLLYLFQNELQCHSESKIKFRF